MVCLVILAIGGLFVIKNPDGKPWLIPSNFYDFQEVSNNFTQFKNTILHKINALIVDQKSSINEGSDSAIYKWKDASGTFHYSDQGKSNKDIWLKPNNLTIMPSIIKSQESNLSNVVTDKKLIKNSSSNEINTTNISKLIENAKNVQNLIDNRKVEIDSRLK